jgi:RNA polymerase sigma-70 factor, ECF subfamily
MRGDVERALELIKQKTPEAFEQALGALQDTVFAFSMKACGHPEDAEDTMQDVLLQCISYVERFESARAFTVWLYKVARNRCLTHRRQTRTVPISALSLDALMPDEIEMSALMPSPELSPEQYTSVQEQAALLHESVLLLPRAYREMLVLHDMEDLDYSEVAEVTGVKEATVRVRVHRARLFVRKELSKRSLPPPENVSRAARPQDGTPQSCRALFAKLSDYLDGDLKDDFCAEMQRHLRDCPPCIAFLASLEKAIARCRAFRPATRSALSVTVRRELMTKYEKARDALAAGTF